jgi:hypothetical protein
MTKLDLESDLPGVQGTTFTIKVSREHFTNPLWLPSEMLESYIHKIGSAEFSFSPNTRVPKRKRALKKYLKKHRLISLLL